MSQQVREWQVKLNTLGHKLKVDGIFGPKTFDAMHSVLAGSGAFDKIDAVLDGEIKCIDPGWHLGVDVSGWQDPAKVNWKELWEDGYKFAIVKTSQGTKATKSYFKHAVNLSKQAPDMKLGAYHFASFKGGNKWNPVDQADVFIDACGGRGLSGPLVLDVEWQSYKTKEERIDDMGPNYAKFPAVEVRAWIRLFVDQVYKRTGRFPWIYTGNSFFKYRIKHWSWSQCPLWLAKYASEETMAQIIRGQDINLEISQDVQAAGMPMPAMRQYAGGRGRALDGDGDGETGYSGALDQNIFWGRLEELR